MNQKTETKQVPDALSGYRLDQVLVQLFPEYSRSRLQQWLKSGHVLLDGARKLAKDKVYGGEQVQVALDVALSETVVPENWSAQSIPLDILYEDESLIVINKPAGLVVHPGAGNIDGTLANALLHHDPSLENLPRAGVIHRLDKDTTGVLVVARSHAARNSLVAQLEARSFDREYRAIVRGVMTAGGTVDEPIGRHPTQRTRMAVVQSGKEAVTHYRVLEKFRAHSYIQVNLETGRTHQIRVHMAKINHALAGDPVYAGRFRLPGGITEGLKNALTEFRRQALHACRLGFLHPETEEFMQWEVPLPDDMEQLLSVMREDRAAIEY